MYIFNTSYTIEESVLPMWLGYMGKEIVPRLKKLEWFISIKLFQVITDQKLDGAVYSLQLETDDIRKIGMFEEEVLPSVQELIHHAFGEKALAFNTLLKEVEVN